MKSNPITITHPHLLLDWDLNNEILPQNISSGSDKKVFWNCHICNYKWQQSIYNRAMRNTQCKGCKSIAIHFPSLKNEWHKNNTITPYDVFQNSNKKVWWICHKGHEWQARIYERTTKGCGCPYCSGQRCCSDNCLAKTHPKLAAEWSDKNQFSSNEITSGSDHLAWWECKNKHSWQCTVSNRKKRGCPYCSGRYATAETCLSQTHPELAGEWHYKNELNPNQVSKGSAKKIWWICKTCSHEWKCQVYSRTGGHGCPNCKDSIGEKAIEQILNELKLNYSKQYKIEECRNKRALPFDFSILENQKCVGLIEHQGIQHYKPIEIFGGLCAFEKRKQNDLIKKSFCKTNTIPLLCIPYNKINKAKSIIQKFISICGQETTTNSNRELAV